MSYLTTEQLEQYWNGHTKSIQHRGCTIDIFKHHSKRSYIICICDSSESYSWTIKEPFSKIQDAKERGITFLDTHEYLNYR